MRAEDAVLALAAELGAPFLLAVDGRCAAGKTTLSAELAEQWDCNVIHMDDFYLPFRDRTPERMAKPGGHMDLERLREEVLLPLRAGAAFCYRPYDCHRDIWLPERFLDGRKSTVVEGCYSCHPHLSELYDAKVFLDISREEQLSRLRRRNAGAVELFLSVWIPREEQYFYVCGIRDDCDLVVESHFIPSIG